MEMKRILAVGVILLFIGVTIAPTINFNTVKASQQNIIKERINQRELLFQTIVDIAKNKEIQRIILKSQMSRGIFPTSEFPVITKNQIRQMYFIGLILSKVISKSRMQSLIGKYQFNNQEIQKEINAVIEKDTFINSEITQLKDSECDCDNKINQEKISTTDIADNPIICGTLLTLLIVCLVVLFPFNLIEEIFYNTIFAPLVVLFELFTLAIWLPFALILMPTVYLFLFTFDCYPYVYPPY